MMWDVHGKPIDAGRFGRFEPARVLNYYDGPRIFTVPDADDALCLACWSDEDDARSRFLVVPTTDAIIADLEAGRLTVREALAQPRFWVVDVSHAGPVSGAWLVNPRDVPEDAQPRPRTMLHRSLEPVLNLRPTGHSVRPAEIPGRVDVVQEAPPG